MPYISTPPGCASASKMVTLWPSLTARSPATVSPAGPEPTTAIRGRSSPPAAAASTWSVLALVVGGEALERADGDGLALVAQDADLLALVSCGQTRPQTAGSAFFC